MLVHKYYCRPANPHSEASALDEIARYVQARNGLLKLKEKWHRITDAIILPEYRAKAAELRVTPRVGRKPTKERSDHDELRAADQRMLYAEFVAAGGSYATWWLADAACKKAKHLVRDEHAGRAGLLADRMRWEGSTLHYAGTTWTMQRQQFARRPMPEGARVAQSWLQRERTSTSLLRKPRYRWYLVVVLDVEGRTFEVPEARTEAAVDIAWRQDTDGGGETLRVAYVSDETGAHRSIKMTATQYSRLQHAESLQALGDSEANILRKRFGVPATTSHRRLCELARIDAAGYVEPAEKRIGPPLPTSEESSSAELAEHMVHLLDWSHREKANAIASRDEHYLLEVRKLCRAHHTIYIEKIKGTPKLVQKKSTRKKKSEIDNQGGVARDQRQMAAPFSFLRLLQREAPRFNTEVIERPAAFTSRICADCGHDMGPSSQCIRVCQKCERKWDVDLLATINLRTPREPEATAAE